MMEEIRCFCGELILKSYEDNGKTKLRSAILVFNDSGVAKAVCRRCKLEHEVPVALDPELRKSTPPPEESRKLFIRKKSPEVIRVSKK